MGGGKACDSAIKQNLTEQSNSSLGLGTKGLLWAPLAHIAQVILALGSVRVGDSVLEAGGGGAGQALVSS